MACNSETQKAVNELSARLRREVIFHLIKCEFLDHRQPVPERETLAYEIERIASFPVATRMLRSLFNDAREYRRELGLFPAPATIADLQFCVKNRYSGMFGNRCVYGWLPNKEDADLRELPAFKALAKIYAPFIANGQKVPAPRAIEADPQAQQLARITANALKMG